MSNIALCADGNIRLCADGNIKLGCPGCVIPCSPDCIAVTFSNVQIGFRKADGTTATSLSCSYHGYTGTITLLSSTISGTTRTTSGTHAATSSTWQGAFCDTGSPSIAGVMRIAFTDLNGDPWEYDLPVIAIVQVACPASTVTVSVSWAVVDIDLYPSAVAIGLVTSWVLSSCEWIEGNSRNSSRTSWTKDWTNQSPFLVLPTGWGIYQQLGSLSLLPADECADCNPLP